MSNYTIKFTTSGVTADPLSAVKIPFTVTEGTLNTTGTTLTLCGHNYPNYGELLWTNLVHLLENFAGMAEPSGTSTIGQLWYDSSEGKLKIYKGSGVGEGYQYITGDDSTLLNAANLDALLKTFDANQHATPYFDARYIQKAGDSEIGTLNLSSGSDLVVSGSGTVKVDAEPSEGIDVVNKYYLGKVFKLLGYDIDNLDAITSIYLPTAGGDMKENSVIKVPSTGSIEIYSTPTLGPHAITKGYADTNYVSFAGPNTTAVKYLEMGGPLKLETDSCNLPTDSLQAVPAIWVTKQIADKMTGQIGAGTYIPINGTNATSSTEVNNNLAFKDDKWITVNPSPSSWADQNLVLNQARGNALYVKKAGDTLASHPFNFTAPTTESTVDEEKTTKLNVPTCGWVNHRILTALAGTTPAPVTPVTPTTSTVTSGTDTATGISYIDYGNGMVTMSGITKLSYTEKHQSGSYINYYALGDITFPSSIKMKLPYDTQAYYSTTVSSTMASLSLPKFANTLSNKGCATGIYAESSMTIYRGIGYVIPGGGSGGNTVEKNPYQYDITWTVTGFKK